MSLQECLQRHSRQGVPPSLAASFGGLDAPKQLPCLFLTPPAQSKAHIKDLGTQG